MKTYWLLVSSWPGKTTSSLLWLEIWGDWDDQSIFQKVHRACKEAFGLWDSTEGWQCISFDLVDDIMDEHGQTWTNHIEQMGKFAWEESPCPCQRNCQILCAPSLGVPGCTASTKVDCRETLSAWSFWSCHSIPTQKGCCDHWVGTFTSRGPQLFATMILGVSSWVSQSAPLIAPPTFPKPRGSRGFFSVTRWNTSEATIDIYQTIRHY